MHAKPMNYRSGSGRVLAGSHLRPSSSSGSLAIPSSIPLKRRSASRLTVPSKAATTGQQSTEVRTIYQSGPAAAVGGGAEDSQLNSPDASKPLVNRLSEALAPSDVIQAAPAPRRRTGTSSSSTFKSTKLRPVYANSGLLLNPSQALLQNMPPEALNAQHRPIIVVMSSNSTTDDTEASHTPVRQRSPSPAQVHTPIARMTTAHPNSVRKTRHQSSEAINRDHCHSLGETPPAVHDDDDVQLRALSLESVKTAPYLREEPLNFS